MFRIKKLIFSLRIEELLALLLFVPMVVLMFLFHDREGFYRSDIDRLTGTLITLVVFIGILKLKDNSFLNKNKFTLFIASLLQFLREIMPFAFCILIYTNMHDMVHLVNPNDIDSSLIKIDQFLLGTQPSFFFEDYISKPLTDYMSFAYSMFFWYPVLVPALIYFRGNYDGFRKTLTAIILTFYIGYLGYVIFPAVGPKFTLANQYHTHLNGGLITDQLNYLINFNISEYTRRDCFPSLHNAVTLLTLLFSFKYLRWFFYLMLPLAISLFVSTLYLRFHYFIDMIAGYVLALAMFYVAPKIDELWKRKRTEMEI